MQATVEPAAIGLFFDNAAGAAFTLNTAVQGGAGGAGGGG